MKMAPRYLTRCPCGTYTDNGILCVNCAKVDSGEEIELSNAELDKYLYCLEFLEDDEPTES